MAARNPILFTSADSNAKVMSGTAGALTAILNSCLIVDNVFSTTSAESVFTDNAAAARTSANAASDDFAMFPTGASGDRIYIGMTQKFDRVKLTLGTLGVGGSYVVEYWDSGGGGAWTAVPSLSDGTSGLTASGTITWSIPATWATKAVNSITEYWIRIRVTSSNSTNPQVTALTVTGWIQWFAGTNKYVYQQGGGNQMFMRIRDNAGGTGGAKEALYRWFETIADIDAVTNTGPMPTAGQSALTDNSWVIRKSTSADATARTWALVADDRTFYVAAVTGDNTAAYYMACGGDFFSMVPGDPYRVFIIAQTAENSGATANHTETNASVIINTLTGHLVMRAYTGASGAVAVGKHGDVAKTNISTQLAVSSGVVFPNTVDGGIYMSPLWISEGTTGLIRGRFRGWYQFLHAFASLNARDTFSGSGSLAGRAFMFIGAVNSSGNVATVWLMDVSTATPWESNS